MTFLWHQDATPYRIVPFRSVTRPNIVRHITFWQSREPALPDSVEQWPLNWIATDILCAQNYCACFYLLIYKKYSVRRKEATTTKTTER